MAARQARYGPADRYPPPPGAGMCISAFAVMRRGDKVVLGQPSLEHFDRWTDAWVSGWLMYSKQEVAALHDHWRLPSSYLLEGEHPDDALRRIMRDQLGVRGYTASSPSVFSATWPSDWYPGQRHWDLAFVYEVRAALPRRVPPWWRTLAWADPRGLPRRAFGWNDDLMEALGLLGKGPRTRARRHHE